MVLLERDLSLGLELCDVLEELDNLELRDALDLLEDREAFDVVKFFLSL